MNKRRLAKLILFSAIGFMFLSCAGKNTNNQESTDKSGKRIVETGELAAIESRAFVMPRFGRMWFNLKVIGPSKTWFRGKKPAIQLFNWTRPM